MNDPENVFTFEVEFDGEKKSFSAPNDHKQIDIAITELVKYIEAGILKAVKNPPIQGFTSFIVVFSVPALNIKKTVLRWTEKTHVLKLHKKKHPDSIIAGALFAQVAMPILMVLSTEIDKVLTDTPPPDSPLQ